MTVEDDSTAVFFVCRLCLRLYTLSEDLRGHMIGFHGWQSKSDYKKTTDSNEDNISNAVKVISTKNNKATQDSDSDDEKNKTKSAQCQGELNKSKPANSSVSKKVCKKQEATETTDKVGEDAEIPPLPFKSFRLLLRSNLTQRCPVSNLCNYKFEDTQKLELHVRCHTAQGDTLEFNCFECKLSLPNWRQCSVHLWKIHHKDVDLLHCPVCLTFKAHTSVHVWRHMRVHKKWRPLVLRTLRAVQKRKEAKQLLPTAALVGTPSTVQNRYYSEKTCEICGRKFVNGKTLSKHVKTVHSKIKPFICNICGAKTARKASLNIHMRQHTNERPLQCFCKFSTRDPSVLKKHQQRHNKTGLLKCKDCPYSCIQAISLKRHIRFKHPESFRNISCDICTFTSANEKTLLMHKEDHRRGLISNADDSMDASRCESKNRSKLLNKSSEISADCFLPLESVDSLPHEPAVDTGGVTIPAPPSEDTQFPIYLNN